MSGAVSAAKGEMVALRSWHRPVERIVSVSTGSVSTRADGRVFLGATRTDGDFSKDVRGVAIRRMLDVGERAVPGVEASPFHEAWAGLRPLSSDRLPLLGADRRPGLIWATGHLGMGIISAPSTAEAVAALIAGKPSPVPLASSDFP
jgi:glycine oxidase